MSVEHTKLDRLRRKLAQRDQKIAGQDRRIAALEAALAARVLDAKQLPRDITKAVQDALCNVRMIPVFGRRLDRIEVREVPANPGDSHAT